MEVSSHEQETHTVSTRPLKGNPCLALAADAGIVTANGLPDRWTERNTKRYKDRRWSTVPPIYYAGSYPFSFSIMSRLQLRPMPNGFDTDDH
ncbi:hypothetical protein CC1G_04891 [Coprinopsis cinerea okayama7|uniref:Uncharacterized protein n=1 Tax=Coprinopsis cinerea (strain Okayama-7 / 130 / ATCC MYA-4618 / FGSC 9003) TaxID=240176 RepID=A8PFE5_COPC7|nr:hypothetical protein CC1G_04891 [Coprinopsis cinerea okayama7\|eukprot:XP_001841047.2 hypothetical protein CC1G_04891 [Coprinopsis cinerea okayama7\